MARKFVSFTLFISLVDELERCEEDGYTRVCVQLLARFEMPHPDNRVEYDFWYSSSDEQAMDFLVEWEESHYSFKKDVFFTPRFVSYPCQGCEPEMKEKD